VDQPTNQTVQLGDSATFAVAATGSDPLTYQWSVNGTNLIDATNAVLILTNVQSTDAGAYAVLVTNTFGSILSSNAFLAVQAPLVLQSPSIVDQPTNQTVQPGATATLAVVASGSDPLSYQWSVNGTNLLDATNSVLVLTNVQPGGAGAYSVLVINAAGTIISSNAFLTIQAPDHFAWNSIASPRVVNVPFNVTIQAQDAQNRLQTNFNGAIHLGSQNGIPVQPGVSGQFQQGLWSGSITVSSTASNLVLIAADDFGHQGLANPINVIAAPQISVKGVGNTILLSWSADASAFTLETTTNLSSGAWTPVSASLDSSAGKLQTRLRVPGTNAFYRLRLPNP
jgi:hypothetical protein